MNWEFGVCVSVDERAYIEIWDPLTFDFPENKGLTFEFKVDTDYNQLVSLNSIPLAFNLSPRGKYLAIMLKDRILRLFNFKTGKLVLSISENLKTISEIQENPNDPSHELCLVDRNDFDRRVAIEKEI
jgi:peptidylprolyl isomerase domain and WD repeat-containing protein 1